MYASFLGISEALHLGIFHQPPNKRVLRQAPRQEAFEISCVSDAMRKNARIR